MEARATSPAAPATLAPRPIRAVVESAAANNASKASPFAHVLAPPASLAPFPRLEELEQHSSSRTKRKALDEVEEFLMESTRDMRRSLQVPALDKAVTTDDMRVLFGRMEEVRLVYLMLVSHLLQLFNLYHSLDTRVSYCMEGIHRIRAAMDAQNTGADGEKHKDVLASRQLVDLSHASEKKPVIPDAKSATIAGGTLTSILDSARARSDSHAESPREQISGDDDTDDGGEVGDEGFCSPQGGLLMGQKKRAKLPPQAVVALRHWLQEHQDRPYPSEEDKKTLTSTTGLSIVQINNWFSNARRRYLSKPGSKAEKGDPSGPRAVAPSTQARNAARSQTNRPILPFGAPPPLPPPSFPFSGNVMALNNVLTSPIFMPLVKTEARAPSGNV